MNFNSIIYNGLKNLVNKVNLKAYCIREYKKAQRDYFYSLEDFFNPIFQVIERHKKEIENKFEQYRKQETINIEMAKKGKLEFYNSYYEKLLDKQGVDILQYNKKQNKLYFEVATKELQEMTVNDFKTNIDGYKLDDLIKLEQSINGAIKELQQAANNSTTAGKGQEQITLNTIFDNDEIKVSIIREAIKDLNIVKASTERTITGFIDGCKEANAFPEINTMEIMKAIFHELGKEFGKGNKPRYDKGPYITALKKTKKHFGV